MSGQDRMAAAEAHMLWPRLRFGDGFGLDLSRPVDKWQREGFEREWRAVSVKVEWLRSPLGRLDRALDVIVSDVVENGS